MTLVVALSLDRSSSSDAACLSGRLSILMKHRSRPTVLGTGGLYASLADTCLFFLLRRLFADPGLFEDVGCVWTTDIDSIILSNRALLLGLRRLECCSRSVVAGLEIVHPKRIRGRKVPREGLLVSGGYIPAYIR